ncbi:MAG: DUF4920 domain-containing protein [Chitinophagaceae bacterium]
MRKVTSLFIAIGFAAAVYAQPPAGDAKPGDFYGEKINAENAISIAEVPAKLTKDNDQSFDAKITAKVLDVCPKKGCWAKVAVNDSTTAFIQMKDYGFFLPTAIKGKTIVIDGAVKLKTTSVEDLKHYAEDAKKSKEEIAAITQPEKEINVMAKGILVVH